MKKLSFIICLLITVITYADPVTVPNTFTGGTPAKASEVNDNFAALANVLKGMSRYSLYQNGKKIASPVILTLMKIDTTGYLVAPMKNKNSSDIYLRGYASKDIQFPTSDCSGSVAYATETIKEDIMVGESGVIMHGGNGKAYVMMLPATSVTGITTNSLVHEGACYVRKDLSWYQAQPSSSGCPTYSSYILPWLLYGATTCNNSLTYPYPPPSVSDTLYPIQENNASITGIQTASCSDSNTSKPAVCVVNGEMKYQ